MPTQARRGGENIAATHSKPGIRRRWVVSTALRLFYTGKTRYPLYRRLSRPRGGLDSTKISPLPGFNTRTVQPMASRHTDWATPAAIVSDRLPPFNRSSIHLWELVMRLHYLEQTNHTAGFAFGVSMKRNTRCLLHTADRVYRWSD
jgi:hypothetical protein